MTKNHILTIDDKKEEKFLRKRAAEFVFSSTNRKEVNELIVKMRKVMQEADGIGLSANQIGLDYGVFVARVPDTQGHYKFYAVFNPEIEKLGEDKVLMEEGCLSVLGTYGTVLRPKQITIRGALKNGKPIRIKAWGLLARVFQHEIDHLNGTLFIDKASELHRTKDKGIELR